MALSLSLCNPFLHKNISPSSLSLHAKVKGAVGSNQMRWSCRKKDIHPQFFEDAKVYCNGELVMTTGGTKKEYVVDVWSGNHPFYLGSRSQLLVDADQVEKFRKKFSGLDQFMEIPVLKGEIVLPPKRKSKGKRNSFKDVILIWFFDVIVQDFKCYGLLIDTSDYFNTLIIDFIGA